jgi:hypothetical protein
VAVLRGMRFLRINMVRAVVAALGAGLVGYRKV